PRSRRARTSRLALALSSAKLRSPSGDTMAWRSGCSAAQWAAVIPTLAAASKRASLSSLIRSLPSFPSVPRQAGSGRCELREVTAARQGGPGPPDRYSARHLVGLAPDHVRHHAHALGQLDQRHDVEAIRLVPPR